MLWILVLTSVDSFDVTLESPDRASFDRACPTSSHSKAADEMIDMSNICSHPYQIHDAKPSIYTESRISMYVGLSNDLIFLEYFQRMILSPWRSSIYHSTFLIKITREIPVYCGRLPAPDHIKRSGLHITTYDRFLKRAGMAVCTRMFSTIGLDKYMFEYWIHSKSFVVLLVPKLTIIQTCMQTDAARICRIYAVARPPDSESTLSTLKRLCHNKLSGVQIRGEEIC